ncbi:Flp pilus assembly protein, pilin Flp, partial [Arthrobacter sp. DR-2P]
ERIYRHSQFRSSHREGAPRGEREGRHHGRVRDHGRLHRRPGYGGRHCPRPSNCWPVHFSLSLPL